MSRVVVVGDALLDRDVLGTVERLCPDAPVPVVDERRSIERPGGAGLAARLAAGWGSEVTLVAALGADHAGRTVRRLLAEEGVDVVRWRDPASTVEKERVHVQGRPIVRVDRGVGARGLPPPPLAVVETISGADAILVSDYGRGVAADEGVRRAITDAAVRGTPVVWDPHPRGPNPPSRVSLATPNVAEVLGFDRPSLGDHRSPSTDLEALLSSARRVQQAWAVGALAVTRGAAGAMLVTGDGVPLVVPVDRPTVGATDTCGAGDAFAAACAVDLAGGAVLSHAVQSAVDRASVFVAAGGALSLGGASARVQPLPAPAGGSTQNGPRVVATGGCFDLLHAGHVATLERARLLGDRLVVLLNSDASVRRLKGPGRPLQSAVDRAAVLRSLGCVDEVIVFDEDTPISALRRVRPAVFVKGGDYSSTHLPETDVLRAWGGVVVTVPYLAGRSTTGLVEQIGARHVG
jgi:rfaE bifunctional protein nucleotidyltransferase chain/domain/rfaE bifunctional protein kinase chain/domain